MGKLFDKTVAFVERINSIENTVWYFKSVIENSLVPEDREKLLISLIEEVNTTDSEELEAE